MKLTFPSAKIVVEHALFLLGTLLIFGIGYTTVGPIPVFVASAGVLALRVVASRTASSRRGVRLAGRCSRAAVFTFHVFAMLLCVVLLYELGWTVPRWGVALGGALVLVAMVSFVPTWRFPRVPLTLPLGFVCLICLLGWNREEGRVRCDDYQRVRGQPGVEVLFQTVGSQCPAGSEVPIGRFPRRIWESEDASRYVFTTTSPGGPAAEPHPPYDGLFCEASTDGTGQPRCVGGSIGKAHQVDPIPSRGQLFGCAWGLPGGPDGRRTSAIFRLSTGGPLTVLEKRDFPTEYVMYGFFQPATDEYRAFTDGCGPMVGVHAADFSRLPELPLRTCPGATHYDAPRDEGVMCGGPRGIVAFRAAPFSQRTLQDGLAAPLWLSWGCDWDPAGREVYATFANLGLLVTYDYDSGVAKRKSFLGFGLRSVAFDRGRRRIYVADFLRGDITAVDVSTGATLKRWYVGHYVRELRLSRDGKKLLTTSNLGIIRIALD